MKLKIIFVFLLLLLSPIYAETQKLYCLNCGQPVNVIAQSVTNSYTYNNYTFTSFPADNITVGQFGRHFGNGSFIFPEQLNVTGLLYAKGNIHLDMICSAGLVLSNNGTGILQCVNVSGGAGGDYSYLDTREAANNVTQKNAIDSLSNYVVGVQNTEIANNATQKTAIDNEVSLQAANNNTQANLINSLDSRESANNATQSTLITANNNTLNNKQTSDNTTIKNTAAFLWQSNIFTAAWNFFLKANFTQINVTDIFIGSINLTQWLIADNSTQSTLITANNNTLTNRINADNTTQSTQISNEVSLQAANNATQKTAIDNEVSLQSANNATQSTLITANNNTLTNRINADNSTQENLMLSRLGQKANLTNRSTTCDAGEYLNNITVDLTSQTVTGICAVDQVGGGGSATKGFLPWLFNDTTWMYFNETKFNASVGQYGNASTEEANNNTQEALMLLRLGQKTNLSYNSITCSGTDKYSNLTINNGVLTGVCTTDQTGGGSGGGNATASGKAGFYSYFYNETHLLANGISHNGSTLFVNYPYANFTGTVMIQGVNLSARQSADNSTLTNRINADNSTQSTLITANNNTLTNRINADNTTQNNLIATKFNNTGGIITGNISSVPVTATGNNTWLSFFDSAGVCKKKMGWNGTRFVIRGC